MSTNTTTSKAPLSRAPDDRFKSAVSASDQSSVLNRIDVNSFELDESFDDNSDPYNSTGRFLTTQHFAPDWRRK